MKENTATKSRPLASGSSAKAPLTQADLIKFDNDLRHKHAPAELHKLISPRAITFSGAGTTFNPEAKIQRLNRESRSPVCAVDFGHDWQRGMPGETLIRSHHDEVKAKIDRKVELAGHRPDWADLVYHPKLAGVQSKPKMVRKNGRVVDPLYVFGSDARVPFYPSGYPWQCIGRVFAWTDPSNPNWSWSGSGALVGKDTVLTAGHVVPWNSDPWMVQFVPAYYNGTSTLGSNVYSYVQSCHGYRNSFDSQQPTAWDYAVMKLYDPLGDSLGWFGSKTYSDSWNDGNYWNLVGYPGAIDNAQEPSWQNSISFHDDDEDGDAMELETNNGDSTPGDSGGPMFAWWADGWPYIVGVVSGQEEEYQFPFSTEDNNIAAGGSPMVDLILWAQSNWG